MADEPIQFGNDLIQYSSSCPWPEFPHDLQIQIMERLPLECCYRLRSVCKAWNHLLSSTHFIRIMGSRQPWLLLCTPKLELPFLLYSFFTNSWRPLSLSFLQHHKVVSGQVNYRGSAYGMLLLDVMPIARWGNMATLPRLSICNPLIRTVFSLPQMPSEIHVMAKGIVPGDELDSYVVLVVGMKTTSNSVVAVEAYDSLSKSWRTTGTLPDNLGLMMDTMIFCKEFFYCFTTSLHGCDDGQVVAYNIKEGNATIIPLPATDKNDHYWPRLLSSRGGCDLLIVGAIEEDHILKDLVIWKCNQNCKLHYCWTEIGRMPASVCEEFRRSSCSTWFECIRVGEYICFRTHEYENCDLQSPGRLLELASRVSSSVCTLQICPIEQHGIGTEARC